MNRVQTLAIAFFAVAWISLLLILAIAPDVYSGTLTVPDGSRRIGETLFLLAVSALIALLGLGVLRRWRRTFWLLLVAFLAGVLRVPASILEIAGTLPTTGPAWTWSSRE